MLTAVTTDKKTVVTRTFHTLEAAADWVSEHNGVRNIYWSVNRTFGDHSKHPELPDVKELTFLHVDLDPRVGENIAEERERIQTLLTTKLPQGVPPPSIIIWSGGGLQGFWRLTPALALDGSLVQVEDAKLYNIQLELLFGADNCHNVNRIMRLPGTVNLPDAKKARKGRTPELARLLEANDRTYPISTFTKAPKVELSEESSLSGTPLLKIERVDKLGDINALDQWGVPERIKIIVVQGHHPEEKKTSGDSRSEWLFDAVCGLLRGKVPDSVIYSIITDPAFAISSSVLDKGGNVDRYARRQIERAKEHIISPCLRDMNERFAVIANFGGRCRVVEEVIDHALKRPRLTKQSFEDFRNRWMNILVEAGKDDDGQVLMKPAGHYWLSHVLRRQYESIVFAPGQEIPPQHYNMWKGFACEARPGDCDIFLEHIFENVCQRDEGLNRYILGWMARGVQRPDTAGQVAVVLRGGRGVGKSKVATTYGSLFGRHYLQVSNPNHLVGNFNSHLRDVVFLFADEAFFAGDRKHAGILKMLITEEVIPIEAKGLDVESAPNYVHLMMASNDDHVIPAGGDERRFFVVDVGTKRQQDSTYFRAMDEKMASGGREALLHHLLNMDLKDYEVRRVPQTMALHEQKQLSLSHEADWWFDKLVAGRMLSSDTDWKRTVRCGEVVDDYLARANRFRIQRRASETALGQFVKKMCPGVTVDRQAMEWEEIGFDGFVVHKRGTVRVYKIPSLEVCRARWEELYGPERWDSGDQAVLVTKPDDTPF